MPIGSKEPPNSGPLQPNLRATSRSFSKEGMPIGSKEPPKVTPEAKQQAQDEMNKHWFKSITGQDLPIGKKAAVVAATALGAGMFGSQAQASSNIDIKKINQIESSGDEKAIGDNGKAFGINKVHLGTLSDYNKAHGTSLTQDDLMHRDINDKVADWYYNTAAPKFIKSNKLPDTIENRIAFYNEGPGNFKKRMKSGGKPPLITSNYVKKYNGVK